MIATLRGTVTEKSLDSIVLEVHGVGYRLLVTANDYDIFVLDAEAKLYVYENIREDAYDLFGFAQADTKRLFEQLISVKNVGPKSALAVLGIGNANSVRSAIAAGDIKLLQTAKGVGKRAAEQMIVELRDKVGLVASSDAEGLVNRSGVNVADEALQALLALGYSENDATLALQNIDQNLSTEDRIKQALKG